MSRRLSVVTRFYATAVIDGVLPTSPADRVRRPHVPPESPTLGMSHLQFDAILQAARNGNHINDFTLVTMLALLGLCLRIFEAGGANIEDLREEHGHRAVRARGKGGKGVLAPPPPGAARDRACRRRREERPILRTGRAVGWTGTARPATAPPGRRRRHQLPKMHPHILRHTFVTTMLDAGMGLRDVQVAARHADPRDDALRPSAQEPRSSPNCIQPACLHRPPTPEGREGGCRNTGPATDTVGRMVLQIVPSVRAVNLRAVNWRRSWLRCEPTRATSGTRISPRYAGTTSAHPGPAAARTPC